MIKKIFVPVLGLFWLSVFIGTAQLVDVELINSSDKLNSYWEITSKKGIIITNSDIQPEDTVFLSLNINTLFYLNTSFQDIDENDSTLLELSIDDNKTLIVLSAIGEGDFQFPFVTGAKNKQLKIVGGKEVDISSVPWQVYLEAGDYMCGGSILNEKWVITAAHCTEDDRGRDISASDMLIKVGATNPYDAFEGKIYSIKKVYQHEDYSARTVENDIALLEIDGTIDFENAESIEIVTAEDVKNGYTAVGALAEISGWGLTGVKPDTYASNLKVAEIPIVSYLSVFPFWGSVPGTQIMAGYFDGRSDACSGDSGGPLVVETIDGKRLAGIVSWGSEECNTYGAYTRVSSYEDWIRNITGIQERFRPARPVGPDVICQGTAISSYILDSLDKASNFEWTLYPEEAAHLIASKEEATLNWNENFYGTVTLKARVVIDNELSLWSTLEIDRAENTSIISQSNDTSVCASQSVELLVNGRGHNLAYRWYNNDNPAQSGILNYLRYTHSAVANSGKIVCDVVGSCGTVKSNPMGLTVYPVTDISKISEDVEVAYDNPFEINVSATGHNLSYVWYKDGEILNGENEPEYYVPFSNATYNGLYSTVVSGTCGVEFSDTVFVYSSADDPENEFSVNVWPTYTRDIINLAINSEQPYEITIYNTNGQLMYRRIDNVFNTTVDLSGFVSGLYLVKIKSQDDWEIAKIVLQ